MPNLRRAEIENYCQQSGINISYTLSDNIEQSICHLKLIQAKKSNDENLEAHLSLSGMTVPLFKLQIKVLKFLAVFPLPICSPYRVKVGKPCSASQSGAFCHHDQLLELRHIIRNPVTQQRSECRHTFLTPSKQKADQKIMPMTNKSHHAF